MSAYILVVLMQAHYGQNIAFQEFSSKESCEIAAHALYNERTRIEGHMDSAFCVKK